jgi:hypothetical protein
MELHEIIGWIGNIFVIIQFTMSDMKKLRVYGIIGATIWLVVAIMINNISLMALNVIIIGIQVYHLHKIHKKEKVNVYDLPIIQDIDIDPSIKDYEIREGDDF